MTHDDAVLLVPDVGQGRLEPEEEAAVRAHVAGCTECSGLSDAYRVVTAALRGAAEHPDAAALVAHAMGTALRPEVAEHLAACPSCSDQAAAIRSAESELGARRIPVRTWYAWAAAVALPLLLGYSAWVHLSVLPGMRATIARTPETVALPLFSPALRGAGGPIVVPVSAGQRSIAVAVAPALPRDLADPELLRIEVRDADGDAVFSREITAGEVRKLSGDSGAFALVLPVSVLPTGEARLSLHSASRGELLAVPFRVEIAPLILRVAASILLALLVTTRCSGPPPPAPDGAVDLAECPQGDAAWRAAIGKATGPDDLAQLEATARDAAARCPERWEPRWAAAETLYRRSKYVEARAPFDEALARARATDDATGIACAANRLGSLLFFKGEVESARASFEEALAAARRAERADLRAFVLNNLAALLMERGEFPRAAVLFDETVETLRGLGMEQPARAAAYNGAVLRMNLGDFIGARAALEQIHADAARMEDAQVASSACVSLGNLLLTAGDLDGARAWYERASADVAQVTLTRDVGLARVALAQDDLAEAERRLDEAVRLGRANDLVLDALLAETWATDVQIRRGQYRQAQERLTRLEAEARKAESTQYVLWLVRWQSGRAWRAAGDWRRAAQAFREAVELLEAQTAALLLEQEGLHFLLGRSDPYTDLADALARQRATSSQVAEVLRTMERAHARRLRRAFGAGGQQPAPAHVEAVQASLQPGELLVDYLMSPDRGVALVISQREARAIPIGGLNAIAEPLARWRAALVRPLGGSLVAAARPQDDLARDADAGEALRRGLLDPLGSSLDGARRIWVVPDGDLALLPLASLPAAQRDGAELRPLGEQIEFGTLAMAGTIARREAVRGPVLVAGDPLGTGGGLGPLARARLELDGVQAAWPSGSTQRLEGDRFLRKTFVELPLERYGAIHLATHALASSVDPRRCAVVFSRGETLGLDAIARLKLGPSLVVLSACRSGEGEVIPGQGVVGLGWAFLVAGARELVVSLWSVEDAAAAELMVEFHARLRAGDDTLRALSTAQAKLRRERPHPAYWAPFIVVARPGA